MLAIIILILQLLVSNEGLFPSKPTGGCHLDASKSFSSTPPLFINPKTGQFVRAASTNGTISFKPDEKVLLACTGNKNIFLTFGVYTQEVLATCVYGDIFEVNGKLRSVKDIRCKRWPDTEERRIGSCLNNYTLAHIGFNISTGFIDLIELCHDSKIHRTAYTKIHLTKEAAAFQRNVSRPNWLGGTLFKNYNVDKLFNRKTQIATIGTLLGSPKLGQNYIKNSGDYYFARGHLAPKADFFYGTQQMATFYYSNAAPQWQTSNGQNWMAIEVDVRRIAKRLNEDLIVYTGIHGIDTLPDINGKLVPLSLDPRGLYPVPRMYWKLVHRPLKDQGIVFVTFNSPYVNASQIREEILCHDVCHQIKDLTWNQRNIKKGYSYCCEVNEFLKHVKDTPRINVTDILKW